MSLAMGIVDLAVTHAVRAESEQILSIDIEIGGLAGVLTESLVFCFEAAARHTIAEKASLNISDIPAESKCLDCDQVFPVNSFTDCCPSCNSCRTTLVRGQELQVKSIVVDD